MSYDPLARLREIGAGSTTRIGYDGIDRIAEYNGSNTLQRRYVHGPGVDEPIVWYEGSGTSDRRWLHADERGSVIAISDSGGNAAWINKYDEYGKPAAGNVGRFQYTGQAWLPEAGVYYYKARMYAPHLGRFLQPDPIGYEDGANLYAYVSNDPINFSDPLGLDDIPTDTVTGHKPSDFSSFDPIIESGVSLSSAGQELRDDVEGAKIIEVIGKRLPKIRKSSLSQSLERNGPKPPSHDDDDPDYNDDLNKCRALADPGARARCYESAELRRQRRNSGVPEIVLPPLILWRIQPLPIPSPRCLRLRHPLAILGCEVITN